jgi:kynurenine formamidase
METVAPIVCRGILLDVPSALNVYSCEAGQPLGSYELSLAAAEGGVDPAPGDVILIRTGWARCFDDDAAFTGRRGGMPGPDADGAAWLAFEQTPRRDEHDKSQTINPLPVHKLLIAQRGIHIIEVLNLEELAAAKMYVFTFVLASLPIVGGTGSPVRPLALVVRDSAG